MAVLPDRDAALRIAVFLDEHAGWSAFWDKHSGVWRVSEDDPGSELYAADADAGRVIAYMTARDVRGGEEAAGAARGASTGGTAAVIDPRLIAFVLPGVPGSVPIARFHVRAALAFYDLGQFADDAAVITSELFFPRFESVSPKLCPTSGSCLPAGSSCGQEHPSSPRIFARSATEADLRTLAALLPLPRSRLSRRPVKAGCLMRHAECGEELVTNAVQHACCDTTETVGVALARVEDPDAVIVTVSDPSPRAPVMHSALPGSERGRGLQIVESLSAHWGWRAESDGKAVFAILAGKADA